MRAPGAGVAAVLGLSLAAAFQAPPPRAHRCTRTRTHALRFASAPAAGRAAAAQVIKTDVLIVGAGIAGLAMASILERKGVGYVVVEKERAPREGGTAIGLWTQAWKALKYLGIDDVLRKGVNEGRVVRIGAGVSGKQITEFSLDQCTTGAPHEFRYVMRSELLRALLKKIPPKKLLFGAALAGIAENFPDKCRPTLEGGRVVEAQVVVGADGVGSTVYKLLNPQGSIATYSGYQAIRGIARFAKQRPNGRLFEQGVINQVWGSGTRLGAFMMSPNMLYWFITYNSPNRREPDDRLLERAKAITTDWSDDWGFAEILANTREQDVLLTSIGDRLPRFSDWGKGRVSLIGDAAHPMTPNLGQGGAAGIEDAIELAEAIAPVIKRGGDVTPALRAFEKRRGPRCAKLTLKSAVIGSLLQIDFPPVCWARDNVVVPLVFKPGGFLDHTKWEPPPMASS